MGEGENAGLILRFDEHLRVEFRGARVTTDAGLPAVRELDEALRLTDQAGELPSDSRTGKNTRHDLAGLLRQSVYARLAGYEDVNDQEALARDPAMRAAIGRKAPGRNAASQNTVSRFETETLATEDNIEALSSINGSWVSKAMERTETKKVILDKDSSESPVHGHREGSAYNGHFGSTCYHPLFVAGLDSKLQAVLLGSPTNASHATWHMRMFIMRFVNEQQRGMYFASFGTGLDTEIKKGGRQSADEIHEVMCRRGLVPLAPPFKAAVHGPRGPLAFGELERAFRYGFELGTVLENKDRWDGDGDLRHAM